MDKIMQTWSDLQSKRRKCKIKMEGLFAFVRTPSQYYKVKIEYMITSNHIYMKPMEQDVMHTYESITLDDTNMAGFDNQGSRIRVNRFGDRQPYQLEFANEATMNVVLEYLRKVARDESFDSTTPSPPPPDQ